LPSSLITGLAIVHTTGMPVVYSFELAFLRGCEIKVLNGHSKNNSMVTMSIKLKAPPEVNRLCMGTFNCKVRIYSVIIQGIFRGRPLLMDIMKNGTCSLIISSFPVSSHHA